VKHQRFEVGSRFLGQAGRLKFENIAARDFGTGFTQSGLASLERGGN
jgi:hypothetical protein